MFPNGRYWEINIPDQEINYRLKLTYHMHRSEEKQVCLLTAPVTRGCLLSLLANKRNILIESLGHRSLLYKIFHHRKRATLFAFLCKCIEVWMVHNNGWHQNGNISRKSFLWHLSKMIHRSHHSLFLTIVLHCTCKNFDFRMACISTTTLAI